MSRSARWRGPNGALLGAMMTAIVVLPAQAQSQSGQDENSSRGVRIIDAPTPPPGTGNASTVAAPSVTVPTLTPPVAAAPPAPALTPPIIGGITPVPALSPAPELRPIPSAPALVPPAAVRPNSTTNVGAVPAAPILIPPSSAPSAPYGAPSGPPPALDDLADLPKQPDGGVHPTPAEIAALSSGLKIPNPAGLAMQILPGPDIAVGSQVSFQVSSKKAGYLILVDVETTGKLVQIYPNPMSLMLPGGVRENANFLRPGKPVRIPDRENPYSGFEFVASPPTGTAMVVAILGDRQVQLVDLPDVPGSLAGSASAV
jgi:hypothetical protein